MTPSNCSFNWEPQAAAFQLRCYSRSSAAFGPAGADVEDFLGIIPHDLKMFDMLFIYIYIGKFSGYIFIPSMWLVGEFWWVRSRTNKQKSLYSNHTSYRSNSKCGEFVMQYLFQTSQFKFTKWKYHKIWLSVKNAKISNLGFSKPIFVEPSEHIQIIGS